MQIENKKGPFGHAVDALRDEILMSDPAYYSEQGKEFLKEKNKQLEAGITHLMSGQIGGFGALVSLVRHWGAERGIIGLNAKATKETQFGKLLEEVEELNQGIKNNDLIEIIDAIGDCTVVLILLADLAGTQFEACLHSAYEVISQRTGKMVNGMFVKDAPASIDDDLDEPLGLAQVCNDDVCESCQ